MHFLIKAAIGALAFSQALAKNPSNIVESNHTSLSPFDDSTGLYSHRALSTAYLIYTQVPPKNPIPIDGTTTFSYTVTNENFMGPPAPIASITSKNSNTNGNIPVLNSNNCPTGLSLGSSCSFSFLVTPNNNDIAAKTMTLTTTVSSAGQTLDNDAIDKTTVQVGLDPTAAPTVAPTIMPSTLKPTVIPSATPTDMPITAVPSVEPTDMPVTAPPSVEPTNMPVTAVPSVEPTDMPVTALPSAAPSATPTDMPVTAVPSATPTNMPVTALPSAAPSATPTDMPVTAPPSVEPTDIPVTALPSVEPTDMPVTAPPSVEPTDIPVTAVPSVEPTDMPISISPTSPPTHAATTNSSAEPHNIDDDFIPGPTPPWCSDHAYICYLLPILLAATLATAAAAGYKYSQNRKNTHDSSQDNSSFGCTYACLAITSGLAAMGNCLNFGQSSQQPQSTLTGNQVTMPLLNETDHLHAVTSQQRLERLESGEPQSIDYTINPLITSTSGGTGQPMRKGAGDGLSQTLPQLHQNTASYGYI